MAHRHTVAAYHSDCAVDAPLNRTGVRRSAKRLMFLRCGKPLSNFPLLKWSIGETKRQANNRLEALRFRDSSKF